MGSYRFNTKKVCCRQIRFDLNGDTISRVQFLGGGCEGNLRSLSILLEGANARETSEALRGTPCGKRGTSCCDQLAMAIETALENEAKAH